MPKTTGLSSPLISELPVMIDRHHPFHSLLPQQAPSLRLRALKLTANAHRAEDLVQTTLMKAWANRDRYVPETNLRAWLFTILRNTLFSEIRKYRREIEDADSVHALRQIDEPRQEATLALKEVFAALELLPEGQRRAILLMSAFGYSQLEAANACECTVGTIKSRVSRGRAALLLALNGDLEKADVSQRAIPFDSTFNHASNSGRQAMSSQIAAE